MHLTVTDYLLAFNLICSAAAHYSGAQAEILPGARKQNDGDIHTGYVDWWTNVIGSNGNNLTYEPSRVWHLKAEKKSFNDETATWPW